MPDSVFNQERKEHGLPTVDEVHAATDADAKKKKAEADAAAAKAPASAGGAK